MAVSIAKACDFLWAREDESESESEVPTFDASNVDTDVPTRPSLPAHQVEVHGRVPTRTSGRILCTQTSGSTMAASIPRDVHGDAVPMVTHCVGKGDLTTEERALFFRDVQACLPKEETIKEVAQRRSVSEKLCRQFKAKMMAWRPGGAQERARREEEKGDWSPLSALRESQS